MNKKIDYKDLLLRLINSLTLCENEGDISEDCSYVLEKMRIQIEESEESYSCLSNISHTLSKMKIGTIYSDFEEDE